MTEPLQNFSVPRNTDSVITCSVATVITNDTLVGCSVKWALYTQLFAIITNDTPILVKTSDLGGGITIPPSPPNLMEFDISIARTDIAGFDYGNYYYEATVLDETNNQIAVISGIMAITIGANT